MFRKTVLWGAKGTSAITVLPPTPEPCPTEWAERPGRASPIGIAKFIAVANVHPGAPTAAVAECLGLAGYHLFLAGPDGAAVRLVAEAVRREGGRADFIAADVGAPAGTSRWVRFISDRCKRLDGLVWGAITPAWRVWEGPLVEMEPTALTRLFRDQVSAAIEVVRQAVSWLMGPDRFGRVVILGSGQGWYQTDRGHSCGCDLMNQFLDATVAQLVCALGNRARFHFIAPGRVRLDRDYRCAACDCPTELDDPEELVIRAAQLVTDSSR